MTEPETKLQNDLLVALSNLAQLLNQQTLALGELVTVNQMLLEALTESDETEPAVGYDLAGNRLS